MLGRPTYSDLEFVSGGAIVKDEEAQNHYRTEARPHMERFAMAFRCYKSSGGTKSYEEFKTPRETVRFANLTMNARFADMVIGAESPGALSLPSSTNSPPWRRSRRPLALLRRPLAPRRRRRSRHAPSR
eukprot:TRINITY_DN3480_c0_g2_i1.p2 TRINITY_DN3480_c0_g2~~TRINITY_DN3480_c0_g2_i1.p2  ORF type:complete len:129 (+),score=26.17 TRINITY_DN3480_c0_g2_i1:351-737(+)